MVTCSIRNCKSRSLKGGEVRFFTFPRDETVTDAWLKFCKPNTKRKSGRVCSVHFIPLDYLKTLRHILMNESPKKCRALKPDSVPSLCINKEAQPSSSPTRKYQTSTQVFIDKTDSSAEPAAEYKIMVDIDMPSTCKTKTKTEPLDDHEPSNPAQRPETITYPVEDETSAVRVQHNNKVSHHRWLAVTATYGRLQ